MTKLKKKTMMMGATVIILAIAMLLGAAGQRRIVAKTLSQEAAEKIGSVYHNSDGFFVSYGAEIFIPGYWPFAEKNLTVASDLNETWTIRVQGYNMRVVSENTQRGGVAYVKVFSYTPVEGLIYSPSGDPSAEDAKYYDIICSEDGVYDAILEARSGYRLVSRDPLTIAKDLIYYLARDYRGNNYCVARCGSPGMEDSFLVLKERKKVPDYLGATMLNGRACLMRDKAQDMPSMTVIATEMETEYTFLTPVSRPLPDPKSVDTIKGDETPNSQRVELESPSI